LRSFFKKIGGFLTHFTTITSKTSTPKNEGKKFTKGIQGLLTLILQGAKKAIFFTLYAIILQSIWSIFLKKIPHITLILQGKILWLELKKIKK
jgi:hypothetical protein